MPITAGGILEVLDEAARNCVFPMLDNGYVYPAAARLSLYRSPHDWAMIFETFGFSPRAGTPDLLVTTFASRLNRSKSASDFVTDEAFQNYLRSHPHDEQVFYHPIDDDWIDPDDGEAVSLEAKNLVLRGRAMALPGPADYLTAHIVLEDPGRPRIFEVCRVLADRERGSVLATLAEREASLPQGMSLLLVLDEWNHPDIVDPSVLPSGNLTFQQLAAALESADMSIYCSPERSNTHWSNWPNGGML